MTLTHLSCKLRTHIGTKVMDRRCTFTTPSHWTLLVKKVNFDHSIPLINKPEMVSFLEASSPTQQS
jgi:hypothetical protein